MFTFQAPSPRCHLHKSLYQSPFTQAPSPEYAVSGDYGSSVSVGSAKGPSSRLTVAFLSPEMSTLEFGHSIYHPKYPGDQFSLFPQVACRAFWTCFYIWISILSEICTALCSKFPLKFPRPKHTQIRIADHTHF